MGRFGDSWELMMITLRLVRKDKTILLYPLISGIVSIIILITFISGIFFAGMLGIFLSPFGIILFFILYFILFFIGLYFNTAIIAFASMRLDGGTPTLGDGLKVANENLGTIIQWALVAGTVGMILRAIEKKVGVIGQFIISIIGFAWAMATFFIIPVLIYEKTPILRSIKKSANVFKDTWGETLVGHFAFSIFFIILAIFGVIFIIIGVLMGGLIGFLIGLILAVIYWVFIACFAISAQGVLVAVLYRFAMTRKMHPDFPARLINADESEIIYGEDTFGTPAVVTGEGKDDSGKEPSSISAPEVAGVSITSEIELSGPGASLPESGQTAVKQYMELFDISEVRAVNLYLAGYKKLDDLRDAEAGDLTIVEKINPTVARHIISKMQSE